VLHWVIDLSCLALRRAPGKLSICIEGTGALLTHVSHPIRRRVAAASVCLIVLAKGRVIFVKAIRW
jgi:hypothetical protein